MTELDDLCARILRETHEGAVVPFLGAGANMVGRPKTGDWHASNLIPSGDELRDYLVTYFRLPEAEHKQGLARVAQYADLVELGDGPLFRQLRRTFTRTYEPSAVHRFLAGHAAERRLAGAPNPWPMIVTTNYDDALEMAFREAGVPFDVLSYFFDSHERGCFRHLRDNVPAVPIHKPDEYTGLDPDERCVILKLHGGIDREQPANDSFVITEGHYASYLANEAVKALPPDVVGMMRDCHLLFLGYALRDWNLRVIFMRIWATQDHTMGSWAIQDQPDAFDVALWSREGVAVIDARLEDWLDGMRAAAT